MDESHRRTYSRNRAFFTVAGPAFKFCEQSTEPYDHSPFERLDLVEYAAHYLRDFPQVTQWLRR